MIRRSPRTVQAHVANARRKVDARNIVQLCTIAQAAGIIANKPERAKA